MLTPLQKTPEPAKPAYTPTLRPAQPFFAPAHRPVVAPPFFPPARTKPAPAAALLAAVPAVLEPAVDALAHLARQQAPYQLLAHALGHDPLTGRPVPAAPQSLAHTLLGLLPDGEARYQQLQAAGPALAQLPAWLGQQLAAHQLSGARLTQVLAQTGATLKALGWRDLLDLGGAVQRLARPWLALARDVASFVAQSETALLRFLVRAVLGEAQAAPVLRALDQGGDLLARILRHPLPFLQHLVHAGWHGFQNFLKNGPRHLLASVQDWLLGGLAKAGLHLPARLDLAGVIDLLLQVFDLTKAAVLNRLRQRLMAVLGAANVGRVEELLAQVGGVALTLWQRGPAAAWQAISQQAGDLKAQALDFVQQQVLGVAARAVPVFLATLAVPGGAFVQVARGIYNGVMTFVEKGRQIAQVGSALLGSVSAIAAGQLAPAAQAVETTLVKVLPVALSFLARWLGLDGISGAIQTGLKQVQAPVERAVNRVLDAVVDKAKALWGTLKNGASKVVDTGKAAVGELSPFFGVRTRFVTATGEKHSLYFQEQVEQPELIIESTPTRIKEFLNRYLSSTQKVTQEYKDTITHLATYTPHYTTIFHLAVQIKRTNDVMVKRHLQEQQNAEQTALLAKNDQLAVLLKGLLAGDRVLGTQWDKYELEGLTGIYGNLPKPVGDGLTPDHQPNVATLERASDLLDVTGNPLYSGSSPLKQMLPNQGQGAYTIILHNDSRHKPGRTYKWKGGLVANDFVTRIKKRFANEQVVDAQKRRDIVAQELLEEARKDAARIRDIIKDDANWADMNDGKTRPKLTSDEQSTLRRRITARILDGERQIENQSIDRFKKS